MDNSSPIYTEFLPISRADMEARGLSLIHISEPTRPY